MTATKSWTNFPPRTGSRGVIGGAVGIVAAWSRATLPATVSAVFRFLIAVLIFVYLNSSRVRAAFHPLS